ncbi:MAG: CRISPR-associated protein Csx20 [Thermodesulfobacteriota bacterium]|nr:CRISPR-associated protein Csx20 [Thermodesulfobacteriota bacterium]
MPDLFLLFNHLLTDSQADQARQELGVQDIVVPPEEVSRCWVDIPPEPISIRDVLNPVFSWIDREIPAGSFLLVQGDFGACYLVLEHVAGREITPVYATTRRQAVEQRVGNDTVRLTHTFRHVRFRQYER